MPRKCACLPHQPNILSRLGLWYITISPGIPQPLCITGLLITQVLIRNVFISTHTNTQRLFAIKPLFSFLFHFWVYIVQNYSVFSQTWSFFPWNLHFLNQMMSTVLSITETSGFFKHSLHLTSLILFAIEVQSRQVYLSSMWKCIYM